MKITLHLILLLSLAFSNLIAFSQTYEWGVGTETSSASASDFAAMVAVDENHNSYIVGSFMGTQDFDPGPAVNNLTNTTLGEFDLFLGKFNPSGEYEWAFNLGGTGTSTIGTGIIYDNIGNIILCGNFFGTMDMDPGPGLSNLSATNWEQLNIAKYDTNGIYQWAFNIPVYFQSSNYVNNIKCDELGNIYVTGDFTGTVDFDPGPSTTSLTSNGGRDVFFAKYNSSGNLVYARSFGGLDSDVGYNIGVDVNNNIYLSGWFSQTVDFDLGPGTFNLTSTITGSGIGCCYEEFVAKYDENGVLKFVHQYGGSFKTKTASLILSGDGSSFYLLGDIQDSIPIDMDPSINTNTIVAFTEVDMFIVNYDTLGNFLWRDQIVYDGFNYTPNNKGASDKDGNLYITGNMAGTVNFTPYGAPSYSFSNNPLWSDVLLAKYNKVGDFQWGHLLGGNTSGGDAGYGIAIDDDYSIYLIGQIVDSNDFDIGPGIGQVPFTPNTGENFFLVKYSQLPEVSINEIDEDLQLRLWPNPSDDIINIKSSMEIQSVRVYSLSGRLLEYKNMINDKSLVLELNNLKKGVYMMEITVADKSTSKRFVIL